MSYQCITTHVYIIRVNIASVVLLHIHLFLLHISAEYLTCQRRRAEDAIWAGLPLSSSLRRKRDKETSSSNSMSSREGEGDIGELV